MNFNPKNKAQARILLGCVAVIFAIITANIWVHLKGITLLPESFIQNWNFVNAQDRSTLSGAGGAELAFQEFMVFNLILTVPGLIAIAIRLTFLWLNCRIVPNSGKREFRELCTIFLLLLASVLFIFSTKFSLMATDRTSGAPIAFILTLLSIPAYISMFTTLYILNSALLHKAC